MPPIKPCTPQHFHQVSEPWIPNLKAYGKSKSGEIMKSMETPAHRIESDKYAPKYSLRPTKERQARANGLLEKK